MAVNRCPVRGHIEVATLILSLAVLLSACGTKRTHLTGAERATMRKAPAIHVVHYANPIPEVEAPRVNRRYAKVDLPDVPTGTEIQANLGGYDPTLEPTQRFAGQLSRRAGLTNL